MTSSFLPEPSGSKELFPSPTNIVGDIPFPMDETNIASTSKVKHSAQAPTRPRSKEGSVSKTTKADSLLMVILRGLPGSGKTSLATDLVARAPHGVVLSSDDYFVRDGKYEWRHEDLGRAHEFNQERAQAEVDKRTPLVVIDNTNVTAWEMRPYVEMAVKAGYEVRLMEPNTPWSFDSRELARRNSHGVDLKTIRNMMDRYESGLEIEDLLERWDLAKLRRSSQRGDGGWEDSRGFSFEPLMDIEEDHGHFGSSDQSRENSIREKNKQGKVSRWAQQAGNVENLTRNLEPQNLNWSLIKESITALPGLTPNKNPFDGRNIPTFNVNKHIFGVLPSSDALPFAPNTSSFGGNNQNPNMSTGIPSNGRNQHDINRQTSGVNANNKSSHILPFGDNNQTSGILPSGDSNLPSGIPMFGNHVPAVNQVRSIPQFCERSQPPITNQATSGYGSNNLAPPINQTPAVLPFDCSNQRPVPIPLGNQLKAASPFDSNIQAPPIPPYVQNKIPTTSPFDGSNQAPPVPPFVNNIPVTSPFDGSNQAPPVPPFINQIPATSPFDGSIQAPPVPPFVNQIPETSRFDGDNQAPPFVSNKMPAISPFENNRLSTIGFHSIKPTAAILAFVNNNPVPDLPATCGNANPDPSLLFINNTTPLVVAGDKNTSKKKSRWKERAAAFLKTKELSKQSDGQSQLGMPKDDENFQHEVAPPMLNEAKLPSPAAFGQVANAPKGVEPLPSTSVEQIIPRSMSADSNVMGNFFPTPQTIENNLPIPETSEKLQPTLSSKEESPSTEHALVSNDNSNDSPPEVVDDSTKAHDEADSIPGLTELSPKSEVNIAKPFKLPSAFSFLQMSPTNQPNKTKEKENLSGTEVPEAEAPIKQKSSIDEIPPLPPPSNLSDMPPLPFDPNDPDALPPPPPSPSAILLPPTPVSPSSIALPSMPAPVPPPSPSNISLPDELSLIPQPPPPAEALAVEDIPIPTCTGFNFSITGVKQSKMSRIGIKNPNSFGALMMARKRIKENKNIFNEEDEEIGNAEANKTNDNNEIIETSQKQEATSFGKIDNKRIAEKTVKNDEHEKGQKLKVVPKEPSSNPEHTKNVESNIEDIFPLSKDGYVKAGRSKKDIKNSLASKHTSKDSKIADPPDVECLTPVDPKLRCKLRASKVLTSLGNPTPEIVNPVIDVKTDEPKKAPVLYGGYVTKLANDDELKTFKTASSAKSKPSETETKSNHKSSRRTSPKRNCSKSRSKSPKYIKSKSQKERRSRSSSRSHSLRNKKSSKRPRSRSRSHSPNHRKKSKRTRSRSKSIVYSTEIKRSQRTRTRSGSIVYSEIKKSPQRSQSRSKMDNSRQRRISGPPSRSGSFERKERSEIMRSQNRSNSIEERKFSKRARSSSRQRKVKSPSQRRSGSAERKMSNSLEQKKNLEVTILNKKNKKSRKSKSGERSSKSRKHKKLKSKKSKHKSKSKQRKEKSHYRKQSHGNEDTDSDNSEEKDVEVKSLEDDVESLENLVQKLQQAQGVNENDEQSPLGKQNQLHRIRNLPLPKESSRSSSESDSAKTPDMASEDSDDTICGKSSGEEETWEELKLKWEKKLKTKQKS